MAELWYNIAETFSTINWRDVLDILIMTFLIYQGIKLVRETRAAQLVKGIALLLVLYLLSEVLEMRAMQFITQNILQIGVLALVIVFQPELRRALEQLGEKNILSSIVPFESSRKEEEGITDRTIQELVRACFEMGKARTGALIVLGQSVSLKEYERTGISIDSVVSSQLLLNIFEKNTPLHDGAVILTGNRLRSATCYLPLSDNMNLSKALGTRHRAAVGVSEVSDSLTIVVSEETGSVSVAKNGRLLRNLNQEQLKEQLQTLRSKPEEGRKIKLWKGRGKNEDKTV